MTFFPDRLLAIETSCDETSVAVLEGRHVFANVVSSQIDLHRKWGGVVPEAASRAHVESFLPTLAEALELAQLSMKEIGAVVVTNRPGLVGALSVGVTAAKAIAYSRNIPLLGIHHLEGHLMSIFGTDDPSDLFPNLSLIVSGGHTELVAVQEPGKYELIGQTLDDAAGEAFDKAARLLGLGYPGGQAIQQAALTGNPDRYPLPQGVKDDPLNFSFSGLKTAVLRLTEREYPLNVPDAAASLQNAIVSSLTSKAIAAAERLGFRRLALVGGVAANHCLRNRLREEAEKSGIRLIVPPFDLCTDNAAMIGFAGTIRLSRGERNSFDLDVYPNADLPS